MSKSDERSAIERFLGLFAEVRAGEGPVALLLSLNVFLLLTAYYLVKPVREALILALDSGAEYKQYMSAVIAALLLVLVPIYAKLADGVKKVKLVIGATLFFASHLLVFWLLGNSPAIKSELGLVFFAWVGIFNMMVVAQFWAYANDVYDPERGKRLFPIVALGASIGAALGAKIAALLIPALGVTTMLLIAALVLALCSLLFFSTEKYREAAPATGLERARPDSSGAFALVFKHRYLVLLAAFSLIFSWVNSNGEYMLGRLVKADAARAVAAGALAPDAVGKHIGAFYGDFFFYVNVLGVFLQSFVVSRIVKYFGFKIAFLIMPAIALGNSFLVLALPVLAALRYGKIAENATDYSLNNTVRQMLWLPTTEAMKYKAKQAVDTFFVRMGDVSSALLVYVGTVPFSWGARGFAASNALLVVIWLGLAVVIVRENRRFSARAAEAA